MNIVICTLFSTLVAHIANNMDPDQTASLNSIPSKENSVDPDQLVSDEAWAGRDTLFFIHMITPHS